MPKPIICNCPFCGVKPSFMPSPIGSIDYVKHPTNECIISNTMFDINKWNTRPEEKQLKHELKEAKDYIQVFHNM